MTTQTANETHVVNVRMKNQTIDKIEELQALLHAPSRSDAIRRAIEISDVLAKAVSEGGKLIIQDGKQKREIIIPGLAS